MAIPLFDLNPALDRPALAAAFAEHRRLQVRDLLTPVAARTLLDILGRQTPWGLAWQAGSDGPHGLPAAEVARLAPEARAAIGQKVAGAVRGQEYGFLYGQYPMLTAYQQRWAPNGPHDLLLEHINAEPFMSLVRTITGMPDLKKADAQATLYAATHFLAAHDDSHRDEGWRVAYVLSMAPEGWRPEWGGYLLFYDEEGDVVQGFRPRFNALNLFAVPQRHAVSYVPPFAPVGRFAITGWFRDR